MLIYVGLLFHCEVVFHVFYALRIGLLIARLCSVSDITLFSD